MHIILSVYLTRTLLSFTTLPCLPPSPLCPTLPPTLPYPLPYPLPCPILPCPALSPTLPLPHPIPCPILSPALPHPIPCPAPSYPLPCPILSPALPPPIPYSVPSYPLPGHTLPLPWAICSTLCRKLSSSNAMPLLVAISKPRIKPHWPWHRLAALCQRG